MDSTNNPWAARYAGLLDPDTIRRLAAVEVAPLNNLHDLPVELACSQFEAALKQVFYPTSQCVSILQRLMGLAYAHCNTTYPSKKSFMHGVYAEQAPLTDFAFPICLTGLAGTGKSKLLETFVRLQGGKQTLCVDDQHSAFPLHGATLITVQAKASPKDVLRSIAGRDGKLDDLIKVCRKSSYRNGVPLFLGDEFQFATGSGKANTLVAQILLSLGYIGIPFVFAANFSLLTRLIKRPEEEQQRLLSDVIIVLPDPWSSQDWHETLRAQFSVAPDIIRLDAINDAQFLHRLTSGRKRAMARLLVVTLRMAHPNRGVINSKTIEQAFRSPQYARYRAETEAILTQAIQNRPIKDKKDLWCPIPLPPDLAAKFLDEASEKREEQVAALELSAALTQSEREASKAINKSAGKKVGRSAEIRPFQKKNTPDIAELLANTSIFREGLLK